MIRGPPDSHVTDPLFHYTGLSRSGGGVCPAQPGSGGGSPYGLRPAPADRPGAPPCAARPPAAGVRRPPRPLPAAPPGRRSSACCAVVPWQRCAPGRAGMQGNLRQDSCRTDPQQPSVHSPLASKAIVFPLSGICTGMPCTRCLKRAVRVPCWISPSLVAASLACEAITALGLIISLTVKAAYLGPIV